MTTITAPRIETVERLIEEVEEWSGRVHKIRQKMTRTKRESEPYQDLLCQLSAELFWLKMKAEHAAEAIDEYHESLPEDE
jgi:chromosome segregation ATPase